MSLSLYAAEIDGFNLLLGAEETLYFSTLGWASEPSDTPASTHFPGRIQQGLDVGRWMFTPGRSEGFAVKDVGELILHNQDGALDYLEDYSFDGHRLKVYRATSDPVGAFPAYPSGFRQVFDGIIESIEMDREEVRYKLRSHQETLDHVLQPNLYLGDNTLPAGLEGVTDIKGKPKPLCFGSVRNISPVLVNSSKLIYQYHDGEAAVTAIRDRGVELISNTSPGWTGASMGFDGEVHGIIYDSFRNQFVAIAESYFEDTLVATSPDGATWTLRTVPIGGNAAAIYDLAIDPTNGYMMAVGVKASDDSPRVWTSPDGITWTEKTAPSWGASNKALCVTVGPGEGAGGVSRWVVSGENKNLSTSDDGGASWTARTLPAGWAATDDVQVVTYANSIFMAGGINEIVATSPDAVTWTARSFNAWPGAAGTCYSIAYSPLLDRWVAVGGVCALQYSDDDGVNWTDASAPGGLTNENIASVIWESSISAFMIIADRTASTDPGWFLLSRDGINWDEWETGPADMISYGPKCIAYHPMLGVLAWGGSVSGTGELYAYSTPFAPPYSTEADLLGVAPMPGSVGIYADMGLLRLGSSPSGTITMDVLEGDAANDRTVARVFERILGGYSNRINTGNYNDEPDFSQWTNFGCTVTTGYADHIGGSKAALIQDDSAVASESIANIIGTNAIPGDGRYIVEVIFKAHTTVPALTRFMVYDQTLSTSIGEVQLSYTDDSDKPLVYNILGEKLSIVRLNDGFYRVRFITPTVTAANNIYLYITPCYLPASDQAGIIVSEYNLYPVPWKDTDLEELDLISTAVVGLFTDRAINCQDALNQVARSLGCGWWSDRLGRFRIKQLRDPRDYPWGFDGDADMAVNGAFSTDTDWTKGTNWTISAGVASNGTSASDIEQEPLVALREGFQYRVVLTIAGRTAGTITPIVGGNLGTAYSNSSGTVNEVIEAGTGATWGFRSTADWDGSIDNVEIYPIGFAAEFSEDQIIGPLIKLSTNDNHGGIPSFRTRVRYSPNYTPQTDLAAAVPSDERQDYAESWKSETSENVKVQVGYRMALDTIVDTLLTASADAASEAQRVQVLRGRRRKRYQLTVAHNDDTELIDLGDVINVTHPRFAPEGIKAHPDWSQGRTEAALIYKPGIEGLAGYLMMGGDNANVIKVNPLTGQVPGGSYGTLALTGWSSSGKHGLWFDGVDFWTWDASAFAVRRFQGWTNTVDATYDFSGNTDVNGSAVNFYGGYVDRANQQIYCFASPTRIFIRGTRGYGTATELALDLSSVLNGPRGMTFDPDGNLVVFDNTSGIVVFNGFSSTVLYSFGLPSGVFSAPLYGGGVTKDGDLVFFDQATVNKIVFFQGRTNAIRKIITEKTGWANTTTSDIYAGNVSLGQKMLVIGLRVNSREQTLTITGWG